MVFNKVITAAYSMATNYIEYMNEHNEVSFEVLSHIGEIYSLVPEKNRAEVFLKFKEILFNEGVDIDNSELIV